MSRWRRWVALWARREPATPLALFRIAVALVVLGTLLEMIRSGAVGPIWFPPDEGGISALDGGYWLVEALGGPSARAVRGLIAAALAAGSLLAVGLGSRIAALVALQCCIALFSLHPGTGGGHDRLITNALWLLVLAPSDATLSLAARLRTGRWRSDADAPAWARYLAIFQIAMVYGFTGVQKLGEDWWPWGEWRAIYYSLLLPSWQRFENLAWVAWIFPLTQLATVVTLLWEATWPLVVLALYYRATRARPGRLRAAFNRLDVRSLYAAVGLGVHLGIWALMNVGPFSWISLSYYLCLWHHDEYARLWRRLRRR